VSSHGSSDVSGVNLREVSKGYGNRRAVSDLTLDVESGEFLAILGPSGSGKTTTMRIIAGFDMPDTGEVFIDGKQVTHLPAERRNVNTVFQSYALFPHLSVLENVAYGPRMHGYSRKARHMKAYELLELVRLRDVAAHRPHELSGGMKQRVALARALANEPTVLLLDEPLGALDRKLRCDMQQELRRVQSELGATFIYVTHDQDEALGMADRLAVMRDGRFEQFGTPTEIYDRPASAWVARFVGSTNTVSARVESAGDGALLSSPLGRIAAHYGAAGLKRGDPSLVVVRPEATRFERRPPAAHAGINRLAALLVDIVSVGPSRRMRAVTVDGHAFESIEPRGPNASAVDGLAPGDPVFVIFDTASVRAYHDDLDEDTAS
jgi:ABC-type Fe3+/spermidine/putrescine transport system ATPase subunit